MAKSLPPYWPAGDVWLTFNSPNLTCRSGPVRWTDVHSPTSIPQASCPGWQCWDPSRAGWLPLCPPAASWARWPGPTKWGCWLSGELLPTPCCAAGCRVQLGCWQRGRCCTERRRSLLGMSVAAGTRCPGVPLHACPSRRVARRRSEAGVRLVAALAFLAHALEGAYALAVCARAGLNARHARCACQRPGATGSCTWRMCGRAGTVGVASSRLHCAPNTARCPHPDSPLPARLHVRLHTRLTAAAAGRHAAAGWG